MYPPESNIDVALRTDTAPRPRQFLDRYILGDHIHSSPSCVVVEAEDVNNRSKVVVNLMAEKDNYEREMDHVGLRDGKYIVEVLYSSTGHDAAKNADQLYWNETASKFGYESMGWGLVMPRAQRNLMFIMKTERMDPDGGAGDPNGVANGVRLCLQELAGCLQYMHENKMIHGDVKPLNCGA